MKKPFTTTPCAGQGSSSRWHKDFICHVYYIVWHDQKEESKSHVTVIAYHKNAWPKKAKKTYFFQMQSAGVTVVLDCVEGSPHDWCLRESSAKRLFQPPKHRPYFHSPTIPLRSLGIWTIRQQESGSQVMHFTRLHCSCVMDWVVELSHTGVRWHVSNKMCCKRPFHTKIPLKLPGYKLQPCLQSK